MRVQFKLLLSGKRKRIQREHDGESNIGSFIRSVFSDEFADGENAQPCDENKQITTKWKCMPFNCFKICFN